MKIRISWSRVGLMTLVIGSAAAYWHLVGLVLRGDNGFGIFFGAFLAFVVWGLATAFAALLIKHLWQFIAASLISGFVFLLLWGLPLKDGEFGWIALILIAILVASFTSGFKFLKDDLENRLKLNLSKSLRAAIPRFATPLLLLTGFSFFAYPPPDFTAGIIKFEVPRPVFNLIAKPLLGDGGAPGQGQGLKEAIEALNLPFDTSVLTGLLGDTAPAQKLASETLYENLNTKVRQLVTPLHDEILLAAAVGLFLTLKAISLPVEFLISYLSVWVFDFLVQLGFINKKLVAREQEVYELNN